MRNKREEILPEVFLDLPEVCCLPSEGGAMDEAQRGKPLCVMPSEVAVDTLVGVQPQELTDDLDGEDLRVGELGGGSALAQGSSVFEPVVDEAEDGYNEGAKIHKKKTSATLFGAIGSTLSVGRSSLWLKSSKKLAHGVS